MNKEGVVIHFERFLTTERGVVCAGSTGINFMYLHSDGEWRPTATTDGPDKETLFTGYFPSKDDAKQALRKWQRGGGPSALEEAFAKRKKK